MSGGCGGSAGQVRNAGDAVVCASPPSLSPTHSTCVLQGFWREWHTSFYQWLVRYLYVPLGGNVRRALAVPVVFVFVAVWHEADWRIVTHLLVWAGIMAAAMLPEVALTHLGFLRDKWDKTGYPSLRYG